MKKRYLIYFAGALFDHKELGGNLQLALALEKLAPRYQILLPQNSESNAVRSVDEIRDRDFEMLFRADLILANFDGTELDSGTVVEFCFAKMLDLPAVLLRTDFRRHCGDGSDPWNLMCSNYPRTQVCQIDAMTLFHEVKTLPALAEAEEKIAQLTIDALDRAVAMPGRLTRENALTVYRDTRDAIGGIMPKLFPETRLQEIVEEKIRRGLYL